jgi:hypothetical protein
MSPYASISVSRLNSVQLDTSKQLTGAAVLSWGTVLDGLDSSRIGGLALVRMACRDSKGAAQGNMMEGMGAKMWNAMIFWG